MSATSQSKSASFKPTEKEVRQALRWQMAAPASRAARRGQLTRRAYHFQSLRDEAITSARDALADEAEVERSVHAARQFNHHYLHDKQLARLYL